MYHVSCIKRSERSCMCVWGAGPMRGGSASTSVRGTESQEGARESLKGPIALVNDVLFWCFHLFIFCIVNSNPQYWEKFQCVPGDPMQSCSALQNLSWRPWLRGFDFAFNCCDSVFFLSLYWHYWHFSNMHLWPLNLISF